MNKIINKKIKKIILSPSTTSETSSSEQKAKKYRENACLRMPMQALWL